MAQVYDTPTSKISDIILCSTTANLRLQKGSMRAGDNTVAILFGNSAAFDRSPLVYVWDEASAAGESVPTIITPTGVATGRWRSVAV